MDPSPRTSQGISVPANFLDAFFLKPEEPDIAVVIAGPDLAGSAGAVRYSPEYRNQVSELRLQHFRGFVERLGPAYADDRGQSGAGDDQIDLAAGVALAEDYESPDQGCRQRNTDRFCRDRSFPHGSATTTLYSY